MCYTLYVHKLGQKIVGKSELMHSKECSMFLDLKDDVLEQAQKTDDECMKIQKILEDDETEKLQLKVLGKDRLKIFARRCILFKNILLVASSTAAEMLVPVVPECLRQEVMEAAHSDKNGNICGRRCLQLIVQRCSWPSMQRDVEEFLKDVQVVQELMSVRL